MAASGFLPDNYLLSNRWARRLYFDHAEAQPIFDYHCHLPPNEIADNRHFENLTRIWLGGDHYKWRAMRANGVPERLITGDASDYEKFITYARCVPQFVRNPLHHWSHLELRRYFDIDLPINEANAPRIWAKANAKLAGSDLSVHGILKKFKVMVVCTTDDPVDGLEHHAAIAQSDLGTRVYPAFRPDKALLVDKPVAFNAWCDQLGARANVEVKDLVSFCDALKQRHDFFHSLGARVSDHGMEYVPFAECTQSEAARIFAAARSGRAAGSEEWAKFATYLMLFFGRLDAARGWTKQLHLGALRNNNTRLLKLLGTDAGVDSIGDFPQARSLSRYIDTLDAEGHLPRMVLYNLNPADNYIFAAMCGNFGDGAIAGKMQFGSGWWFLDQREAMEWQLNALSQLGILSRFVGMLTDSRSFLSYVRHEYFRRILCNLIGTDVEQGLIPADAAALGKLIEDICYRNAAGFFGMEVGSWSAGASRNRRAAARKVGKASSKPRSR